MHGVNKSHLYRGGGKGKRKRKTTCEKLPSIPEIVPPRWPGRWLRGRSGDAASCRDSMPRRSIMVPEHCSHFDTEKSC